MHRANLQIVAEAKLEDAKFLLQHERASNAYYLAGYAVEIGLKACITKQIVSETIPDLVFIKSIYSHNIRELAKVAGLTSQLVSKQTSASDFATNWAIVCEWGPTDRYNLIRQDDATLLISAIDEPQHGVLPWIKAHW